ncbi:unnamed protein product [Thlaspi arvense]|uniref:Uncharacterized protein n=1 Tax=Thlaspi arvense TaxID=13288 RepID=A0AAU9S4V5_THLAR|nr:unnamed protein product [Thlaspi arvense]
MIGKRVNNGNTVNGTTSTQGRTRARRIFSSWFVALHHFSPHCDQDTDDSSSLATAWLFKDLSLVKILLNESNRETDDPTVLLPDEEDGPTSVDKSSLASSNDGGAVGGAAPSPTGPSLGSGSIRQTGQVEQVASHVSTQSAWKTCLQFGSSLAVSCSSKTLRHTAHSVAAATSPPMAPTVKVGREAMTVGSRPRLGV